MTGIGDQVSGIRLARPLIPDPCPLTPTWPEAYVGLPYADKGRDRDGVDCWGLVRLVYAELMAIELPSHTQGYVSASELADVTRAIRGHMRPWAPVARPHPLDVVLLRLAGSPAHVGLIVGGGFMLHVHAGIDTALERIDTLVWRRRIVGYYRHVSMADGVGAGFKPAPTLEAPHAA